MGAEQVALPPAPDEPGGLPPAPDEVAATRFPSRSELTQPPEMLTPGTRAHDLAKIIASAMAGGSAGTALSGWTGTLPKLLPALGQSVGGGAAMGAQAEGSPAEKIGAGALGAGLTAGGSALADFLGPYAARLALGTPGIIGRAIGRLPWVGPTLKDIGRTAMGTAEEAAPAAAEAGAGVAGKAATVPTAAPAPSLTKDALELYQRSSPEVQAAIRQANPNLFPGVAGQPPVAPKPSWDPYVQNAMPPNATAPSAAETPAPWVRQPYPRVSPEPSGELPTVRPHRATNDPTFSINPPNAPPTRPMAMPGPGATAEMVKNPITKSALEYFEQLRRIHDRGFSRGGRV